MLSGLSSEFLERMPRELNAYGALADTQLDSSHLNRPSSSSIPFVSSYFLVFVLQRVPFVFRVA